MPAGMQAALRPATGAAQQAALAGAASPPLTLLRRGGELSIAGAGCPAAVGTVRHG